MLAGLCSELQGLHLGDQCRALSAAGLGTPAARVMNWDSRALETVPRRRSLKQLCIAQGPRELGHSAQRSTMPAEMNLLE
jgi:hypothetical protein